VNNLVLVARTVQVMERRNVLSIVSSTNTSKETSAYPVTTPAQRVVSAKRTVVHALMTLVETVQTGMTVRSVSTTRQRLEKIVNVMLDSSMMRLTIGVILVIRPVNSVQIAQSMNVKSVKTLSSGIEMLNFVHPIVQLASQRTPIATLAPAIPSKSSALPSINSSLTGLLRTVSQSALVITPVKTEKMMTQYPFISVVCGSTEKMIVWR